MVAILLAPSILTLIVKSLKSVHFLFVLRFNSIQRWLNTITVVVQRFLIETAVISLRLLQIFTRNYLVFHWLCIWFLIQVLMLNLLIYFADLWHEHLDHDFHRSFYRVLNSLVYFRHQCLDWFLCDILLLFIGEYFIFILIPVVRSSSLWLLISRKCRWL